MSAEPYSPRDSESAGVPPPRAVFVPGISTQSALNWLVLTLRGIPFILLHFLALFAIWTPLTYTSVGLFFGLFALRTFCLTGGYHRYFAHRAYSTSRAFQFFLAFFGACAVQKGPLWWAGHHRSHHRFSDTPADPHSPHETSFWWSHVGWILSNEYTETPHDDIKDFSRFPELRWIDTYHWVPPALLATACFFLDGMSGLVWGFLMSTLLLYHTTFSVNSLNHLFGSRRFATPDDSRNNLWIALLTFGEGWHNNHHHYQSSANQGFYWWEIDISYSVLVVLSWFGIVWDLRRPGERALAYRRIRPATAGGPASTVDQMAATAAEKTHAEEPLDDRPAPALPK